MIINVTGGPDLSLLEVSEASTIIQEAAHEDANIIFGAVIDPTLHGRVKITVIATGFDRRRRPGRPPAWQHHRRRLTCRTTQARPQTDTPAGCRWLARTITRRPASICRRRWPMAAGSEDQVIEGLDEPLAARRARVPPAAARGMTRCWRRRPGWRAPAPVAERRDSSLERPSAAGDRGGVSTTGVHGVLVAATS